MKGKSNLLKKMMVTLLTTALMIGMVVGAVPEEVHAKTTTDRYEYTDNEDGTVTITGYKGKETKLVIPATIDGKTVTAIEASKIESGGNYTSGFSESITEVKIPSSVTSIGNGAFCNCGGLTTITIPEGVKSIGDYAFNECEGLIEVTIPGSVTSIGYGAFVACRNLTEVTIPGSVTRIGWQAFYSCSKLTTVTISEGVESIGVGAFNECYSLTEVTIPRSVTSIDVDTFRNCSSLKSVTYGSCKHNWDKITNNDGTLKDLASNNKVQFNPASSKPLDKKEAKAATCTEGGYNKAYYECLGCGRLYADEKGETPIDADTIIPATGVHTPAEAVQESVIPATCTQAGSYDEVVYCSVCKAEISRTTKTIEKKAHSYGGWTVTKQPTESKEGSKERSCSVCGYKQTEVIPKTVSTGNGDSTGSGNNTGKIETDKEQGNNAPDADFKMSNDDLISAVLTPEEKSLVEAGTDVRIILDIDNIDASVDEADKQAVTDKADGYNVGQYLDINLYKIIGEDKTKVSQTNGKIKIALDVPDSLKNTDSAKTRSFAVVRVHNGVAELLTDLDNDDATISFETDLFSTYALVYKDTANTDKKDDEPKTGDTTPMELYATLAMVSGLSYLLLLFLRNRKKGMKEQ